MTAMIHNNRYASGQVPRVGDVVMCINDSDSCGYLHLGMLMVVIYMHPYNGVNSWLARKFYKIGRL